MFVDVVVDSKLMSKETTSAKTSILLCRKRIETTNVKHKVTTKRASNCHASRSANWACWKAVFWEINDIKQVSIPPEENGTSERLYREIEIV